jgi:hypothetical protein
MNSTAENEKRKQNQNDRVFYPASTKGCLWINLLLVALWVVIAHYNLGLIQQDHLSNIDIAGMAVTGTLFLILPPLLLLNWWEMINPRHDRLILTDIGVVWYENSLRGETTYKNLATLEKKFDPVTKFEDYGIALQITVSLTSHGKPTGRLSQFISLRGYSNRSDSHLPDFFFRRTLLGEALYRKAPQIFAKLEELEKHMGFAHIREQAGKY